MKLDRETCIHCEGNGYRKLKRICIECRELFMPKKAISKVCSADCRNLRRKRLQKLRNIKVKTKAEVWLRELENGFTNIIQGLPDA